MIPGGAVFTLDVRDTNPQVLASISLAFKSAFSAICLQRNLEFEIEELSRIEPVRCARTVIDAIDAAVDAAGVDALHMHSGAAHDAQIIAGIAPAGMIFVPSKEGISHSSAEWTSWEDIETGANILLNTMRRLAG